MRYKLDNLDDQIKSFRGIPIFDSITKEPLTFRKALITICEMHHTRQPGTGDTLRAYDLGIRVLKEKSVEVTKEELEFLKELISQSNMFISLVIGRLRDYLEEVPPKVEPVKK